MELKKIVLAGLLALISTQMMAGNPRNGGAPGPQVPQVPQDPQVLQVRGQVVLRAQQVIVVYLRA